MEAHSQISITCPNCKIEVKAAVYSIAVQCPKCGEKIVLPYGNRLYGEAI